MAKLGPYTTKCGQTLNHFTEFVFPNEVMFIVDYCNIERNEEGLGFYGETGSCSIMATSEKEALAKVKTPDAIPLSAYPWKDYPVRAYRPDPVD